MASRELLETLPGSLPGLREKYTQVRLTTEGLCRDLTTEDCMVQSMPDASPAKWHLAHTTWFFETFILNPDPSVSPAKTPYKPLHPEYRQLFNSYYNAVGDRPLRQIRGVFSRPGLDEVRAYRRHVDDAMQRLLSQDSATELIDLITLGLNHEQQHQELIVTDVKHALWSNPLRPALRLQSKRPTSSTLPRIQWLGHEAGLWEIGHAGNDFSFDNESPRHQVYVRDFKMASRLVTNREYLEFMEDAGYRRPELWLSDGWETVKTQGWHAPLYWERGEGEKDSDWWYYTCGGMRTVDLNEPVCHVSYYEADAYARWSGARLLSEAEWETTCADTEHSRSEGIFLESGEFHPRVATGHDAPSQMFGDVWEWTHSAYAAYPGYRPAEGALGEYNAKFMCNQLVLRGGSCATPKSHIRASYRNFFPPQTRWQFSGIRMAKD